MPRIRYKKAIVAGASGVVGRRLAEYLHGQDDWEVVGLSRSKPIGGNDVPHIVVDLSDRTDTDTKLRHLCGVTHIFYEARFDYEEGQPEPIKTNFSMFRNLIETVEPIAANLEHVHVGSGHKNYGLHSGPAPTPAREDAPQTIQPSFYYQQENFIRALQKGKLWSWSTARPTGLCDTAPGITRSMISLICAYATICRELGLPLRFPGTQGNYQALYQCTEALHLAKATAWMATNPKCANQDFNITNGDTFRWSTLWPQFANYFNMELGPVQTINLAEHMGVMEPVWQRIVEKHGLVRQPLDQVALWSYWQHLWTPDWDIVSSTMKARQFGFTEFVDSEEMFFRMFDHFRGKRVFP